MIEPGIVRRPSANPADSAWDNNAGRSARQRPRIRGMCGAACAVPVAITVTIAVAVAVAVTCC